MKERFILFIISAIMIVGLLTALLIDEKTVQALVKQERADNYAFLGQSAQIAEDRAMQWYTAVFIKTGVTQFTFDVVEPGRHKPATDGQPGSKADQASSRLTAWWQQRMRVLWSIAFQFLVRLSNLMIWIPLLMLIMLPSVVDAFVVRKIKGTNFSLASPHMQLLGTKAMVALVVVYLLLQMAPVVLHPAWAPIAMALFAMATWIGITFFAKRA